MEREGRARAQWRDRLAEPASESGEAERVRFARGYWMLAAEQVDGYQHAHALPANPIERIEDAEAYFAATRAGIVVGGTQGCYRRSTDTIHMPDEAGVRAIDGRTRTETWFAVLGHEATRYVDVRIMPRGSSNPRSGVQRQRGMSA